MLALEAPARGDDEQPAGSPDREPSPRRSREPRVAFALASAVYLAVGGWLTFHVGTVDHDVVGRVADAYGVVAGRDPHVAAIGFGHGPLATALLVPLVALRHVWPALVTHAFAAVVVSSAAMGASVAVVSSMLAEAGVGRARRVAITMLFALNPVVVWAAASGSDGPVVVALALLAARSLTRWLGDRRSTHLVGLGLSLAGAYLADAPAIAAAIAAVLAVGAVTASHEPDAGRRRGVAVLDGSLVALPPLVAAGAWAIATATFAGPPLHGVLSATTTSRGSASLGELVVLASPGLVVVAVLVALGSLSLRRLQAAGPWIVLAALLVSEGIAGTRSSSGLTVLVAAIALGALGAGTLTGAARSAVLGWAVIVAVLVPGLLTDLHGLHERAVSPASARAFAGGGRSLDPASAVAQGLDDLALADGELLLDSSVMPEVVLRYDRAATLVLRSDRDYEAAANRPWVFGVRYLLVSDAPGDSVRALHPDVGRDPSFATFVRRWQGEGDREWVLYAVTPVRRADGQIATSQRSGEPGSDR